MFPLWNCTLPFTTKVRIWGKKSSRGYDTNKNFFSLSKAIRLKSFLKANDVLRPSEEQWVKVSMFWEGHKFFKNLPLGFDTTLYMTKQVEDFFQKVWPSSNILTLKVENCDFQETKYFFPFEKKSTVY